MNKRRRRMIEGSVDKARKHLQVARDHLKSRTNYSESIEASQECIELSVKSVLSFLEIDYPPSHHWSGKEFASIARQIQERQILDKLSKHNLYHSARLPRLLLMANLWGHFYLPAKYGFEEAYLAPAKNLFDEGEAELAVKHASECHQAASELRYLPDEKLASILAT